MRFPHPGFHFYSVNDVGTLYDEVCVTFAAQFQHGIQWSQLRDAALFQAADDDARRIGFLELQLREGGLCLGVDGINGEGAGIVCVVPKCTMSRAALSPGFILASISLCS